MIPYKTKILSVVIASVFSSTVFAQKLAVEVPVKAPVAVVAPVVVPISPPYKGETFDKIKKSGKLIIGNRNSSIPISFLDENKKPIGYATDVCMVIFEKIKEKLSMPNLVVEFVEVSAPTRQPLLIAGKIDLECGPTTNNASRRKEVDFSVPYYVSGIRILTKSNSGIQNLNDLKGKKVSVSIKTSSVPIIEKLNKERDMKISLVIEPDSPSAMDSVKTGKTSAFLIDDILLFSERSKLPDPQNYAVVGDFLSIEPLAIMLRKDDPKFKTFLDKEMISMINNGGINTLYKKWFESPIPPKNQNLNIPQSPLLKDVFRMPTNIVGN